MSNTDKMLTNLPSLSEVTQNTLMYAVENESSYKLTGSNLKAFTAQVRYGSTAPASSLGNDGDIYMQVENGEIVKSYGKINGAWLDFPKGGGGVDVVESLLQTFTITNVAKRITLIPTMTSDTGENGSASASSYAGANFAPYKAFDGVNCTPVQLTNSWLAANGDESPYLQYTWHEPQKLSKLYFECAGSATSFSRLAAVRGSNDLLTWENILKDRDYISVSFANGVSAPFEAELNDGTYKAIRLHFNDVMFISGRYAGGIDNMQVWTKLEV